MWNKLLKLKRNEFADRSAEGEAKFPDLVVQLGTIDSILLLLGSDEEAVLINVLKHIVQQTRRFHSTVDLLREKKLLQLLLQKRFFCNNSNMFVKRLALHLASFLVENSNCLAEFEAPNLYEIVSLCLEYYKHEDDDFCSEYLSVLLNKCSEDPHCRDLVLSDTSFVEKYFGVISATTDPDILINSLELLLKLLPMLGSNGPVWKQVSLGTFPLHRLLGELNCEFVEIRAATLQILLFLLRDAEASFYFKHDESATFLLQQLTKLFCENSLKPELILLVEVLAAAVAHEPMVSLFFELNLFDKYLDRVNDGSLESGIVCRALWVFSECAKWSKFLSILVPANIPEKMLECLLSGDDKADLPLLLGLNRFMASPAASKTIIDSCGRGLLQKLLSAGYAVRFHVF